jgi:hypothetical protein
MASFHSNERIAPSNRGIKHLDLPLFQISKMTNSYRQQIFPILANNVDADVAPRPQLRDNVDYPNCMCRLNVAINGQGRVIYGQAEGITTLA